VICKKKTITLTYIIILIACLFRVIIVIAVCFNLEIKQFNIVNIFMNTKKDLCSVLIAYKLLDRFKQPRIYIKIN
jgi:hypothetical protein